MKRSRERIKILGPQGEAMEGSERWKIAIVIPSRGVNPAMFTYDLAALVAYSTACLVHNDIADITLTIQEGTYIHVNRNDLMGTALKSEADYTLWLDDDMRFPRDALLRLLQHNVPLVGVNYPTRMFPVRPTAIESIEEGKFLQTREGDTGLARVDSIGFGCALVMSKVAWEIGYPWFESKDGQDEGKRVGEDVDFCIKAKAAGFDVFVDHGLSQEVRHIGQFEYSVAHAVAYEEEHGDNNVRGTEDSDSELVEPPRRDDGESNSGVHLVSGGDPQP